MPLPIIAAALSVGSSIYGGVKSAVEGRKSKREIDKERARENAWYARAYHERYADTEAGSDLMRRGKEYADENWKKVRGQSAVTGATDAASALAKEQGVKQQGELLSKVAANDTSRRDRVDLTHRRQDDTISERERAVEAQTSKNIADAASQASNNLMNAAVALEGMKADSTVTKGADVTKAAKNDKYLTEGVKAANAKNVGKSANGTPKSEESVMPKPENFGTDADRRRQKLFGDGKPAVGSYEWEKQKLEEEEKRLKNQKQFNIFEGIT